MLIVWPILVVRARSKHQCASDEHSRHDGGTGYCIGWVLADSILAATTAAAMVKFSFGGACATKLGGVYVNFVPASTYVASDIIGYMLM